MYDYQFESIPAESEIMLLEEPTDLLKEQIRKQFTDPLGRRFDYVSTFIENYKYSLMQLQTEDDKIEVDAICDDFIRFLMNIMTKYFDVGFPELENKSTEDQLDLLHMVYRYFIINIKHNVSSFCINYIIKHKDRLVEEQPKKKDIMTLNLRHDIIDEDAIVLVSNLYDIIIDILNDEHDVDDFLAHSDLNEPRLETEEMIEYYDNYKVVGNFVKNYTEMAMNTSYLIKEIEGKIRNKLLKPFRKNFKKVIPTSDNEIHEDITVITSE